MTNCNISWHVFDPDGVKHYVSIASTDASELIANMKAMKAMLTNDGFNSGASGKPGSEVHKITAVCVTKTRKEKAFRAYLYTEWSSHQIGSVYLNNDGSGGFKDIEPYFEPGALRTAELVSQPITSPFGDEPEDINWSRYAVIPVNHFSVCMVPKLDRNGNVVMKVNPITKQETGNPVMVYSHVVVNGQRVQSNTKPNELPKDRSKWTHEHVRQAINKKATIIDNEIEQGRIAKPIEAALQGKQQEAGAALHQVADVYRNDILEFIFNCTDFSVLTYGQADALVKWSDDRNTAKIEVEKILKEILESIRNESEQARIAEQKQEEIPF